MIKKLFVCIVIGCTGILSSFSQTRSLEFYFEQSVQHSPLLKDYKHQLQSKDVDSLQVAARLKPQINANSVAIYAPVYNGYGYDEAITNGGTFSVLGGINVPLLNNKLKQAQYGNIGAQKQGTVITAKLSEHDLKKNIADQYFVAYRDAQQLIFSEQVNTLLREETDLLKLQVKAGIFKQSDLLALMIELHANEIAMEQLKKQYRDDLFALNYGCGIMDTTTVQLEKPAMEYHSALTVYNSPAFLKFTVDSITIESNRKLIDANYRPKLNAFADAGINSISLTDLQKKIGYSVGANFSIPLYDGHQRKLEYNRLQLAEQTRKDYRDFYNSQVIIRLQQLDAEKLANESILQKLKNEQHEIETLLAMNREDLNHGIISVTDYIVNLRRFIQLKSELNAVEVRTFIVINEYNYITW